MNARIREYLDALFRDVEDTQKLKDFKEELAANLSDRVADLRASGLDEDQAFGEAVSTLGDIRSVYSQGEVAARKRNSRRGPWGPWPGPWGPWRGPDGPWSSASDPSRREGSTLAGSLFLIALALYLYLGFNHLAGGFGSWWVLFLVLAGSYRLLRGRHGSGVLLISLAAFTYVESLGFLSSVLLLFAIFAALRILRRLVTRP